MEDFDYVAPQDLNNPKNCAAIPVKNGVSGVSTTVEVEVVSSVPLSSTPSSPAPPPSHQTLENSTDEEKALNRGKPAAAATAGQEGKFVEGRSLAPFVPAAAQVVVTVDVNSAS